LARVMAKLPTAAVFRGAAQLAHTTAAQALALVAQVARVQPLAHREPTFSECCLAQEASFLVPAVFREALVGLAQTPVGAQVDPAVQARWL